MTAFGSVQTNDYNGDGLRARKQATSGRTYYIYDGDQVVGEFGSGTSYLSALNTWGANGLLARHTRAGSQRRGSDKRQMRQGAGWQPHQPALVLF